MATPPSSPRSVSLYPNWNGLHPELGPSGPPPYPKTQKQLVESLSNKLRRLGVSERIVKILYNEEFDEEALMYIVENPYPSDIEFWNSLNMSEDDSGIFIENYGIY